jgi:hypothetical protein
MCVAIAHLTHTCCYSLLNTMRVAIAHVTLCVYSSLNTMCVAIAHLTHICCHSLLNSMRVAIAHVILCFYSSLNRICVIITQNSLSLRYTSMED